MDLFAGKNAPLFTACQQLHVDLLAPLDLELGGISWTTTILKEFFMPPGMVLLEGFGVLHLVESIHD